jgi:hypothetical protein
MSMGVKSEILFGIQHKHKLSFHEWSLYCFTFWYVISTGIRKQYMSIFHGQQAIRALNYQAILLSVTSLESAAWGLFICHSLTNILFLEGNVSESMEGKINSIVYC